MAGVQPERAPAAVVNMVQRLDEAGTLELNTYDTYSEFREGDFRIGLGGGGGAASTSSGQDTTGRYIRAPGGVFQPRRCPGPSG